MSEHNSLVSVIVPVYKVEDYIERCVISLFEQTYQNIEFIFVDDYSPDNSISVLEKILEKYTYRKIQVKIVRHDVNKGSADARNTGLDLAKGNYVMFADPDDYTDEHWVKSLVYLAENTKSDIVFCDYYNVCDKDIVPHNQAKEKDRIDYIKNMYSTGNLWTKIYKKSLFEDNSIRFPSGLNIMEDLITNIKLYYFAKKIEKFPKPLYYYVRTRNESLTGKNHKKNITINTDMIENIKGIQSFYIEKNIMQYLELELNMLKLISKDNLLINADSIEILKTWKNIFPESNKWVTKSHLPIYYKVIALSTIYNIWIIPKVWLIIKKFKKKYFR